MIPSREQIEAALIERHTYAVYEKLKNASVAVAGLGGLGSNIAVMLTRAGIGHLHLVDFDRVDITNLNRQQYFISQIGRYKTEALAETLEKIDPYMNITCDTVKVNSENAAEIFCGYNIICEAFDRAEMKAMLINAVAAAMPEATIISGNGMAGYGNSNSIITRKIGEKLYICGDCTTDSADANGLMAPRVTICAAHEANKAIEFIIENN